LEKAELLVTVSEENARIERRLREARAADKSLAEADVILERELRVAKEKALANAKEEIEEWKKEAEALRENSVSDTPPNANLELLLSERDQLSDHVQSLSEEISTLKEELERSKKKALEKLDRLTAQLIQAKARANQIEREGRLEAEMQMESARLRAQAVGSPSSSKENDSAEVDDQDEIAIAKLYDVIKKQKQTIEQDQMELEELMEEHDEVCALLTEKELVRESLNATLLRIGGQESVNTALRGAEEQALSRFGMTLALG
jgi:hypothetical protein